MVYDRYQDEIKKQVAYDRCHTPLAVGYQNQCVIEVIA